MKRLIFCLLLLLALISVTFAGTREGEVVEHNLSNGLKVLTVEMHNAPIIFSQLTYKVGSRNEQLGKTGISHLTEHMMFKGTPKYSKQVIKKLIKKNGGVFNAFTSTDMTSYWEQVPKNKIDIVLEIESERMQNCLMDGDEFLREREVVIEERHTRTDDTPRGIFREEMNAIAFKSHPRQNPVIGWAADLKAITIDDVKHYYNAYYTPNNATLALVGDFETDEMVRKLDRYFGSWKNDSPFTCHKFPVVPKTNGKTVKVFTMPGKKQVDIRIGYNWIPKNHADENGLDLMSYILGGSALTSRLGEYIRDQQGLAYGIRCDSRLRKTGGIWWIGSKTEPANVKQLIRSSLKVMKEMKESGVSDQELHNAKSYLLRILPMYIETPLDLDGLFAEIIRTHSPFESFDNYFDDLISIDKENVNELCRKYIDIDNYVIVIAGDVDETILDEFKE